MSKKKKDKKKFTGQVSLISAQKIFVALGFQTAKNWNEAKLTKKIQRLPELTEGAVLETKMQKRVDMICRALAKGTKVTVVDLSDETADKKEEKKLRMLQREK